MRIDELLKNMDVALSKAGFFSDHKTFFKNVGKVKRDQVGKINKLGHSLVFLVVFFVFQMVSLHFSLLIS